MLLCETRLTLGLTWPSCTSLWLCPSHISHGAWQTSKNRVVWRAPGHRQAFWKSTSSQLWSCHNVTVRGASWAIPQMYVKKICLVPNGALAGHLQSTYGFLGMTCRCPVDAFSQRGNSWTPAWHLQVTGWASRGIWQMPLENEKIGQCPKHNSALKFPVMPRSHFPQIQIGRCGGWPAIGSNCEKLPGHLSCGYAASENAGAPVM